MYKNFDIWNLEKKKIDEHSMDIYFKQGDIWWCSIGLNIGSELCGKGKEYRRPILIYKKLSEHTFIGIPLSTQRKIGSWFYSFKIGNKIQYLTLNQIRMFDQKRLQRKIDRISTKDFILIKEKLRVLLELF